eukprot:XP_008676238.1 uncharacterized protein LOC103652430 [Zea mays]
MSYVAEAATVTWVPPSQYSQRSESSACRAPQYSQKSESTACRALARNALPFVGASLQIWQPSSPRAAACRAAAWNSPPDLAVDPVINASDEVTMTPTVPSVEACGGRSSPSLYSYSAPYFLQRAQEAARCVDIVAENIVTRTTAQQFHGMGSDPVLVLYHLINLVPLFFFLPAQIAFDGVRRRLLVADSFWEMGDVLIPSLRCGNLSVTICVRVSRFWDFSDPQDDARLLHCDMVLLDEEGNSIHATIYPPFIEKFRPLIKEGSVYNMTYFRVRASNNLYKPVPNDIMITFTNWTKLEQVIEIPPAFPTLTYSLTHIDQIHSRIDHKDYYTDAIGIVTSVSNVSPHRSKGQQASSLKRNISICSARFGLHGCSYLVFC